MKAVSCKTQVPIVTVIVIIGIVIPVPVAVMIPFRSVRLRCIWAQLRTCPGGFDVCWQVRTAPVGLG